MVDKDRANTLTQASRATKFLNVHILTSYIHS
jgi:hypothetical protein